MSKSKAPTLTAVTPFGTFTKGSNRPMFVAIHRCSSDATLVFPTWHTTRELAEKHSFANCGTKPEHAYKNVGVYAAEAL